MPPFYSKKNKFYTIEIAFTLIIFLLFYSILTHFILFKIINKKKHIIFNTISYYPIELIFMILFILYINLYPSIILS